ncbi:MAG: hypothetical protein JSV53_05455 [candidate division WOR-3 bacterium]|nr:MAG: hypothetical protein JSV53_05455 [candidate division WOR-3 bacterium]
MQKVFTRLSLVLTVAIMLTLCCTDEGGNFEVKVIDPDSMPVQGAWIEGGFDWDMYRSYTDSNGVAIIPDHGRNYSANIFKENFLPRYIESPSPGTYGIDPTEQRLRLIGDILGSAVVFDTDYIVAVSYDGAYSVYTYTDQSITLVSSVILADGARKFKRYGDILWFSTFDNGVFAYSLENILQPQLLIHVDISGYPGVLAVKDSIIAVGPQYGLGDLRIFSFDNAGHAQQLIGISQFVVDAMEFIGNYLVVVGGQASLPTVLDVSNPAQPVLVYSHYDASAYSGFIKDSMLIIVPERQWDEGSFWPYTYRWYDISYPANPSFGGSFTADSWLYDLVDGDYAVGLYGSYFVASILAGDHANGFSTIAIYPWHALGEYGGGNPPYFIIAERLWVIEPN